MFGSGKCCRESNPQIKITAGTFQLCSQTHNVFLISSAKINKDRAVHDTSEFLFLLRLIHRVDFLSIRNGLRFGVPFMGAGRAYKVKARGNITEGKHSRGSID